MKYASLLPLLLLAMLPTTASIVSVAEAGPFKRSKCEAPVQSLPAEVQREVDSQVDATVATVGQGSASASATGHTVYQNVMVSQDELARQTYLYRLCLEVEAGRFPEAQYHAILTGFAPTYGSQAAPVSEEASTSPSPSAPTASGGSTAGLPGRWNVVVTERWSNCSDEQMLADQEHHWSISADQGGRYVISDSDDPGYPVLSGSIDGTTLVVSGEVSNGAGDRGVRVYSYHRISTFAGYSLERQPDGSLAGEVLMTRVTGPIKDEQVYFNACAVHGTAVAHRL